MALSSVGSSVITSKGQIVIPASVRQKPGFNCGQKVAVLEFDDRVEIRPIKIVLDKLEFDKEVEKTRKVLKEFVDKHNLRGIKIKELTAKDKDELAREYFERIRKEKKKQ
jgi:AbrB family looped-hinge helix DNA binding protein